MSTEEVSETTDSSLAAPPVASMSYAQSSQPSEQYQNVYEEQPLNLETTIEVKKDEPYSEEESACVDYFFCDNCSFSTLDRHVYDYHVLNCNATQVVSCPYCTVHFVSNEILERHIASEHVNLMERQYIERAEITGYDVLNLRNAMHLDDRGSQSISEIGGVTLYSCNICDMFFTSNDGLIEHGSSQTHLVRENTWLATDSNPFPLIETVTQMNRDTLFQCSTCNLCFQHLEMLVIHCQQVHEKQQDSAHESQDLQVEQETTERKDDRRIQCPDCSKTFLNLSSLGVHRRNLHSFRCKVCKHPSYTQEEQLKHWKGHPQCKLCDKRFQNIRLRNQHSKKVHLGHQTHLIGKEKTATDKNISVRMKRKECQHCQKSYDTNTSLKRHQRHKHPNMFKGADAKLKTNKKVPVKKYNRRTQPKQTEEFEKINMNLQSLEPSEKEMHVPPVEVIPVTCTVCQKVFSESKFLRKHRLAKHSEKTIPITRTSRMIKRRIRDPNLPMCILCKPEQKFLSKKELLLHVYACHRKVQNTSRRLRANLRINQLKLNKAVVSLEPLPTSVLTGSVVDISLVESVKHNTSTNRQNKDDDFDAIIESIDKQIILKTVEQSEGLSDFNQGDSINDDVDTPDLETEMIPNVIDDLNKEGGEIVNVQNMNSDENIAGQSNDSYKKRKLDVRSSGKAEVSVKIKTVSKAAHGYEFIKTKNTRRATQSFKHSVSEKANINKHSKENYSDSAKATFSEEKLRKADHIITSDMCIYCRDRGMNSRRLKTHIAEECLVKKTLRCNVCYGAFTTEKSFLDHQGSHFQCKLCYKVCDMPTDVIRHKHCHPKCVVCGQMFLNTLALTTHLKAAHNKVYAKTSKYGRFYVQNKHNMYECSECHKAYYTIINLKHHKRRIHPNVIFKRQHIERVEIANNLTRSPATNKNYDSDPVKCPRCKITFSRKHILQKHIEDVHTVKALPVETVPVSPVVPKSISHVCVYCQEQVENGVKDKRTHYKEKHPSTPIGRGLLMRCCPYCKHDQFKHYFVLTLHVFHKHNEKWNVFKEAITNDQTQFWCHICDYGCEKLQMIFVHLYNRHANEIAKPTTDAEIKEQFDNVMRLRNEKKKMTLKRSTTSKSMVKTLTDNEEMSNAEDSVLDNKETEDIAVQSLDGETISDEKVIPDQGLQFDDFTNLQGGLGTHTGRRNVRSAEDQTISNAHELVDEDTEGIGAVDNASVDNLPSV